MNNMNDGMYGHGRRAGDVNGFGGILDGPGFGQLQETGREDPTASIPHLFW